MEDGESVSKVLPAVIGYRGRQSTSHKPLRAASTSKPPGRYARPSIYDGLTGPGRQDPLVSVARRSVPPALVTTLPNSRSHSYSNRVSFKPGSGTPRSAESAAPPPRWEAPEPLHSASINTYPNSASSPTSPPALSRGRRRSGGASGADTLRDIRQRLKLSRRDDSRSLPPRHNAGMFPVRGRQMTHAATHTHNRRGSTGAAQPVKRRDAASQRSRSAHGSRWPAGDTSVPPTTGAGQQQGPAPQSPESGGRRRSSRETLSGSELASERSSPVLDFSERRPAFNSGTSSAENSRPGTRSNDLAGLGEENVVYNERSCPPILSAPTAAYHRQLLNYRSRLVRKLRRRISASKRRPPSNPQASDPRERKDPSGHGGQGWTPESEQPSNLSEMALVGDLHAIPAALSDDWGHMDMELQDRVERVLCKNPPPDAERAVCEVSWQQPDRQSASAEKQSRGVRVAWLGEKQRVFGQRDNADVRTYREITGHDSLQKERPTSTAPRERSILLAYDTDPPRNSSAGWGEQPEKAQQNSSGQHGDTVLQYGDCSDTSESESDGTRGVFFGGRGNRLNTTEQASTATAPRRCSRRTQSLRVYLSRRTGVDPITKKPVQQPPCPEPESGDEDGSEEEQVPFYADALVGTRSEDELSDPEMEEAGEESEPEQSVYQRTEMSRLRLDELILGER